MHQVAQCVSVLVPSYLQQLSNYTLHQRIKKREIIIILENTTMFTKIIFFTCILVTVIDFTVEQKWHTDRRPKIMSDKVPMRAITPYRKRIQKNIVQFHNMFRTRVVPKSANMLRMRWHRGAARAAQKWSDECMLLAHDNITGRYINNYGSCGQNIFVSSHTVPWLFAIKTWYLEKSNFTYNGKENDLRVVGHYTQMVWATTHEVGCGLSRCLRNGNVSGKQYYNYVCNYCPIGNKPEQLDRPYRQGKPCGLCKKHCHSRRLCTNSCNVADLWANCKELYRSWPHWLCNSNTSNGADRLQHCKATCTCRNKIHD